MNRNIFSKGILIIALTVIVQCAIAKPLVNRQVETAVLNENWANVANLLSSVNVQSSSPALRLIKAHALLAQNRNNESLCLFLSVSSARDFKQWRRWADDFAARNSRKAISYYFVGDALARLKRLDAAQKMFDHGIKLQATHPLLLNARGINYAAQEKWDNALIDFYMATKVNSSFADAYASHATMYIRKGDGAEGALNWSNRALEISPDFVLALNTRASANFALGKWEQAQQDFQSVREKATCISGILASNIVKIIEYMNGNIVELANSSKKTKNTQNVGTTLLSLFDKLKSNPSRWNANRFVSYVGKHPDQMKFATVMVNGEASLNQTWGGRVNKHFNDIDKWNSGGAKVLTSVLGGLNVSFGIGYDLSNIMEHQNNVTIRNQRTSKTLSNSLSRQNWHQQQHSNPSGVKTEPMVERLDEGNWPFVVNYGLNYK